MPSDAIGIDIQCLVNRYTDANWSWHSGIAREGNVSPTKARDSAIGLAKTDTTAALALARTIDDPWFRSQALAWIARFASEADFPPILSEGRESSWAAGDKYKIVGSSAWRVRAVIERGNTSAAAAEMPELLRCAAEISHPVSRLEALFLLFESVFEADGCRRLVLDALIDACQVAKSWKSGDRLREAAVVLAFAGYQGDVDQVLAAMSEGKYRRQALERIGRGQRREPRRFFW